MTQDRSDATTEARDQLNLILSFFPRVDTKASVVLAVNTGMLAVLASNAPPIRIFTILPATVAAVAVVMIAASLWFLYRVAFPELRGGQQSLIFFREIANRTEAKFIDEFLSQDSPARLRDLLGQVWRNSEILKMKFDSLRVAFILMALAIIPWVVSVAIFASLHNLSGSPILR